MYNNKNDYHNGHGPFRAVQPYMTCRFGVTATSLFTSDTFINCMLNMTGGN